MRTRTIVTMFALLLLIAACGDGSDETSEGGSDEGGATAGTGAAEEEDEPTAGGLYGGGGGGNDDEAGDDDQAAANADVSVSLNNFLFDPDPVEVSSGDVVAVRNGNARTPHTFTVPGEDVDLELAPLTEGTVEIDLDPGTYDLICRFHEQSGMTATLEVS